MLSHYITISYLSVQQSKLSLLGTMDAPVNCCLVCRYTPNTRKQKRKKQNITLYKLNGIKLTVSHWDPKDQMAAFHGNVISFIYLNWSIGGY